VNFEQQHGKPGIQQVQALADISRSALCCHNNETHALLASAPNTAQFGGTHTISPSYIRVRAVMREYDRQRDTHTEEHDQYIFCVIYDSPEM